MLPKYMAISSKALDPVFLHARNFPVPGEVSWAAHEKAMQAFKEGTEMEGKGQQSLLDLKQKLAISLMESCGICEHRCGVNRNIGETGKCGVKHPLIASMFHHMGEEAVLVPSYTIFFAGCTFECVFCQNWDISQNPNAGKYFPPKDLAQHLNDVQRARNVNWVGGDPTSNLAYILEVLSQVENPLPQVWNSNMYLSEEAMSLLEGVIDLYLTDFKYGNERCARELSNVERYFEVVSRNHILARKQTEVLVRHLVLPGHVDCCSLPIMDWLAENTPDVVVNVMGQYRPQYKASEYPSINRFPELHELEKVKDHAEELGLILI